MGRITTSNDLKGLVSASGVIRNIPIVRGQHAPIFLGLSDEQLEKLVYLHSTYGGLRNYNIETIRQFIFLGRKPPQLSRFEDVSLSGELRAYLRYCPLCFAKQLRDFGVSWFRLDWQCSNRCKIHNEPLFNVRRLPTQCCSRTTNILHNLHSAMTGKCTLCHRSSWANEAKALLTSRNSEYYPILYNENSLIQESYRQLTMRQGLGEVEIALSWSDLERDCLSAVY